MDIIAFKKLGLSDKEISVYLKLLEYGSISVRSLAELAGLNRGTTYDILKKLQSIGLASYYQTETKQHFAAEDPNKLLALVKERGEEVRRLQETIGGLIPELRALQDKGGHKPIAKFYDGKSGIRSILEDVLEAVSAADKKEYHIYSAAKASDDINQAYPDFTRARIRKKIRVKAVSLSGGGRTHGLDERRWLGTDDRSATFIIIYAGKCAFISRDAKNEPVGVIIENRSIYETQKVIFNKIWDFLGGQAPPE